jgi:hypothetical protein
MIEDDFWRALEYRICDELKEMDDRRLRALWCDGLVPQQYLLTVDVPQITGYAWMGDGPRKQYKWALVLFLPGPMRSREALDWSSLLPPNSATEWLEIDQAAETLRIHPTYVGRT